METLTFRARANMSSTRLVRAAKEKLRFVIRLFTLRMDLLKKHAFASRFAVFNPADSVEGLLAACQSLFKLKNEVRRDLNANPLTFGGYVTLGSETPIEELMMRLWEHGQTCALPLHESDRRLSFRAIDDQTDLMPRRQGRSDPPMDAELVYPDVVFVPVMAFSSDGQYLTVSGDGVYDKYLAQVDAECHALEREATLSGPLSDARFHRQWIQSEGVSRALQVGIRTRMARLDADGRPRRVMAVGVAHSSAELGRQASQEVCFERHDGCLDAVLTEQGLTRFGGRGQLPD